MSAPEQASLFAPSGRGADLSADGLYRYRLWRRWADGPAMAFVMLNPSTADADVDDPTIRRCIGFAKREGCAAIEVCNLFAYRTPKPAVLVQAWRGGLDVVGPSNDDALATALTGDRFTYRHLVAAWGAGPGSRPFNAAMVSRIRFTVACAEGRLLRFDRSPVGGPRAPHPLYLPAETPLSPYGASS